ncbi:MAG: insulinase family protein [bacterium]|nr:insulinase family protein [bacterium]
MFSLNVPNRLTLWLLILTGLLSIPHGPVAAALDWHDQTLACGAHLTIVDTAQKGYAGLVLYYPAGTVYATNQPALALMAPYLLLESETGDDFVAGLQELGWKLNFRTDLHGAGVFLAGPVEHLDAVFNHLVECLRTPADFDEGDLRQAWQAIVTRWERMGKREEVVMGARAEAAFYGRHPYHVGLGHVAPDPLISPRSVEVRQFMMQRYRAGGAFLMVAGDVEVETFRNRWETHLNAIPGVPAVSTAVPELNPLPGRIDHVNPTDNTLLIVKYPGPLGSSASSAPTTLLAGVLGQLLDRNITGAGLARSANVWYDFMSPGPRPLEIRVRNFHPDDAGKIEEIIKRQCQSIKDGGFSKFLVISAKDNLFEMLDSGTAKGNGPKRNGVGGLLAWCQTVAWQNLHFQDWRSSFESQLLGTGQERVQLEAQKRLEGASALWSFLLPEVKLE